MLKSSLIKKLERANASDGVFVQDANGDWAMIDSIKIESGRVYVVIKKSWTFNKDKK